MFNPVKVILNTKIRNKLILLCIAVIVPVAAAGAYLLVGMANIARESVVNESYSEASALAAQLRLTLYTASDVAELIYEDSEFTRLFNHNFTTISEFTDYYANYNTAERYLAANPQFKNITFYVDMDYFIYNKTFRKATDIIKDSGWYKDAVSSESARWHLVYDERYNVKLLSCVRAVFNDRGENTGVMVISINPERFETIIRDEVFIIVFSVGNGTVFFSNSDDIEAGRILYMTEEMFRRGASGTTDIPSDNFRHSQRGFTVVSYFDYGNTGNLFQIFLVKPYTLITGHAGRVTVAFIWYMVLCAVLSVLLTILFSSFFSRRIQFLKDEMHAVAKGDFNLSKEIRGTDEIFDLYSDLKRMVNSIQELINDAYEARLQSEAFKVNQIEAEFATLASQINPHFLYNTLETIRMKAYTGGDKETAGLVKQLGKFMRRCLEIKDGLVTLESELEFTNGYLEIQKARFGERAAYSLYCEVERSYKILPLIIQPVVENAFIHGIERIKSGGHIKIKVYYRSGSVYIDVSDNGQGMSEDRLALLRNKLTLNDTSSGKSIGLTNVNKRIKMYHGEAYGLSVSSAEGKGTRVRIVLPRNVTEQLSAAGASPIIIKE